MEKHLGYIAERIISRQTQNVTYEGMLILSSIPACMGAPVSLCHIQVLDIIPLANTAHDPLHRPDSRSSDCLAVILLCIWMDATGRKAESTARIEIQVCPTECGRQIRRGIEAAILRAAPCGACAFSVCLSLCVHTIVTCSEMLIPGKCQPDNCCPKLPLYPQPHAFGHCCK